MAFLFETADLIVARSKISIRFGWSLFGEALRVTVEAEVGTTRLSDGLTFGLEIGKQGVAQSGLDLLADDFADCAGLVIILHHWLFNNVFWLNIWLPSDLRYEHR